MVSFLKLLGFKTFGDISQLKEFYVKQQLNLTNILLAKLKFVWVILILSYFQNFRQIYDVFQIIEHFSQYV